MGILEDVIMGIIGGLGLIGDAIAVAIVAILNYIFGEGVVPPYVGKLFELLAGALTIWTVQKRIPKYLAIASFIAALVIVFGGTYF
jgi:hypothetical protein